MNADLASSPPAPALARVRWVAPVLYGLILLAIAAGFLALWWVSSLPERVDEQQTIVIGPTRFSPDSEASVRVVVQDLSGGKPVPDAEVVVSLQPAKGRALPLYEGRTDASGSAPVGFHVPADAPAEATLVVETRSQTGKDRVERVVTVERAYRLLLTTDKPLYQPGQTIHMRALALSTLDLVPARGAIVDFLVEDAKGNKVYRKSVTASEYGIAAADFLLADLVNQGNYKLSVAIGDTASEKTVEVRPYVLPKFGVTVSTDRTYYLPAQRVEGTVQADYFFGKPVARGQVQLLGTVWDVGRTVLLDLRGETDEEGTYAFSFDLPAYFAGSGLESGQAQFALEVTVIDQTDHAEQTSQVLPIAAQPLVIEAVAESGVLKPGVENVVYILTAYPDGRPAPTRLQVDTGDGSPVALETGAYGLAEIALTPPTGRSNAVFHVIAEDEAGLSARRWVDLGVEYGSDSVLLRADRATYVVGETMHLLALTPVEYGSIYLDIVKAGQTLSTRSALVTDGRAEFAVDVSPDLFGVGTLELHAYKVLLDGTMVRDTRVVVVDAPNEVAISIGADKVTYQPGEMATIDLRTAAAEQGAPLRTALGIAIVDESVFALQRQDPGFAKLYFMLQQELMEPFYQIKAFELPAARPPEEEPIRRAQDDAAQAAWAGASVAALARPVNSRPQKLNAVREAQEEGFGRLGVAAGTGMLLIPFLLLAVTLVSLARAGVTKRSFVRLGIALGILILVGGCLIDWAFIVSEFFYYFDFEWLIVLALSVLGLGLLAFLGYAWIRGSPAAKLLSLLTVAWGALLLLLVLATDRGPDPPEWLAVVVALAFPLLPMAYLLFGQGSWLQARRFGGALTTGLGALMALPAVALVPALLTMRAGGPMVGNVFPAQPQMIVVEKEVARVVKETVEVETAAVGDADEGQAAGEAPRLRQYFPETLYWAPEVLTDENGLASFQVPMADSITTWRLTALASSQDGRLGFATRGIRVFQDFFVDIDLPVSLTQGDEISIPVGVFNYLDQAQEVRLVVEPEPWFELLGAGEQTLRIASNEIDVVYFPIRVKGFGAQGFQVTAWGEYMSDAIRRQVRVVPDGKEIRLSESNWLREPKEVTIDIPAYAVPDTARVEVKIYPGVMAQVIEGLEKILRLPHG